MVVLENIFVSSPHNGLFSRPLEVSDHRLHVINLLGIIFFFVFLGNNQPLSNHHRLPSSVFGQLRLPLPHRIDLCMHAVMLCVHLQQWTDSSDGSRFKPGPGHPQF